MSARIEDYALLGDLGTAALVGLDGSIDWLCVPRFDSGAVFAALLGDPRNGCWRIAPAGEQHQVERRYRGETLVLETDTTTDSGVLRVTDCMPPGSGRPCIVRIAECISGRVEVEMDLRLRFDYGSTVPWVRRIDHRLLAVAGPDAILLDTPVRTHGRDMSTRAEFVLSAGERIPFVLSWLPSHEERPPVPDADRLLAETEQFWTTWLATTTYQGEWQEPVRRSLLTLKALTYRPTGGVVAAPTTSLPEQIGGSRNWDYRYCWLRDTTFTLMALLSAGFTEEAAAWREWLLRAIAGDPAQLQVMYGMAGERRLVEWEVPWLAGFEGSAPVRVGNGAVGQRQLDVYGEVIDALHLARGSGLHRAGGGAPDSSWALQRALLDFLEGNWRDPDEGIWEVRGARRHFVHSKVMAWVALDRAVRGVTEDGLPGPLDRWRALRDTIHQDVLAQGFDADRGTFTQYYGSRTLDAATLLIPLVGFLPAKDPRVAGTVAAIEERLVVDGLVRRYDTDEGVDGLAGDEGVFLMCTFWLADNQALLGRKKQARATFKRLLDLRNDVGLLAEEYDPVSRRMLGNFPQAFSHTALVNTAHQLAAPDRTHRVRRSAPSSREPGSAGHGRTQRPRTAS